MKKLGPDEFLKSKNTDIEFTPIQINIKKALS
jgi:hypothetical protein